jgi:hypothetical protein
MVNLLVAGLSLGNMILSSAIIILSFSLFLYLFANNARNSVARSFSLLLVFITIIYVGDVFLQRVDVPPPEGAFLQRGDIPAAAVIWLKFKWLGIAFIPPTYLHFSDAVLRATHDFSRPRRLAIVVSYLAGVAFLLLVALTDWVVRDGFYFPQATQFSSGPLFPLFALFFFALTGWGFYNLRAARQRTLTPTTRRRMIYLAAAFLAPALGVFPYLIIASFPAEFSPSLLLSITLVGKIGIALMIIVMAYTVAYQGALSPDRVIKHNLIHYLLRGPLVATAVIGLMLSIPPVERWLGLSRETVLYAMVIGAIVFLELIVNQSKRFIDKIIFWGDRDELERIQEIDKRLLTTGDLRQLLENILAASCDLLRVQTGFVIAPDDGQWRIEAAAGPRENMRDFLSSTDLAELVDGSRPDNQGTGFVARDGFWLWRLRSKSRDAVLGLMGVAARAAEPDLTDHEQELIAALTAQAELALEDRQLQQGVFNVLEQITSEIALLQQVRGKPRYAGGLANEKVEEELLPSPDFHRAVKDALDHYWGGPKLTDSPLIQLRIVQNALPEFEGNPTRALRALIGRAIELQKPDGPRSLTSPEWLLYNILELKVIQGKKIREIARQLAMSESDLYRKQRVAIQEVAKTIASMEEHNHDLASEQHSTPIASANPPPRAADPRSSSRLA